MGYAVEMFFDDHTEKILVHIQQRLKEKGLPSFMLAEGVKPHLSLCVYDDLDAVRAEALVKDFCARERRFKVFLGFFGTFVSGENVIFAAPVMNEPLRTIHLRFHQAFKETAKSAWPYYLPGNWQPHCTLAVELDEHEYLDVFKSIRDDFKPMEATLESIGLVKFRPVELVSEYPLQT